MSTVHNSAKKGEIAKNVIMAGDPLRAKFIAENFLIDAVLVNEIRNMLCYTGTYNNKPITVMGSGMGMPSMGIYSHELYSVYDVENIIRVGSCGAIQKHLKLFDTIIVKAAHTSSNFGKQLGIGNTKKLESSSVLFEKAKKLAENKDGYVCGDILTSDIFYTPNNNETTKFAKKGCLGVEMETFGLYAVSKVNKKNALTILTVSDIVGSNVQTTAEQRQTAFTNMITLALNTLDSFN